jgi:uncharacterized protein YbjT (DUF2867 family)
VFGRGEHGVVDPRDIAAVAVEALTGSGHSGQIYTPTGPALLTTREQVSIIGAVVGRDTRTVDQSVAEWGAQLAAAGADPSYVERAAVGVRFMRDGHNAVLTDDVERVTGRPPRSFRRWVADHRVIFD